jgi:hypothetical protein
MLPRASANKGLAILEHEPNNIVCLSFGLFAWNISAPTGQIVIKLDIQACFENLSRKFKFH